MMRARRLYEGTDTAAGAQLWVAHVAQPPRQSAAGASTFTGWCARMLVVALVATAAGATSGCGPASGNPRDLDGAADASDAGTGLRPDERSGDTQMPTCAVARTVCDGKDVRACDRNNKPAEILESCPGSCSLGRCTTAACTAIEGMEGLRGCRFYGAQVDNTDADDARPTLLLISNAGSTPATVRVETRDDGGVWAPPPMFEPVVVKPGATERTKIWKPLLDFGLIARGAYRVESDAPVMVVEIVGDDSERMSRSSGGTVLRPIQALGLRHLALTSPGLNSLEVARTPGSRAGAGAITIVGTAPQTEVLLGLTAVAAAMPGTTLQPRGEGEALAGPFILNEGDVLQIFSVDSGGDLTGSSIDADVPVAVFSGNVFTSYGQKVTTSNGGDMVMEQLPPIKSWNKEYFGVRLSPQPTCDSFFNGAASWRVLASDPNSNGNRVTLIPAPGVTFEIEGMPAGSSSFTLGHGMAKSFVVRGGVAPDFTLSADEPVLLAQWLDCEPGLSWGIDGHLLSGDLAFGLPPGFETEMVVVRKVGNSVLLDGSPLVGQFQLISADKQVEALRIPAENLRCIDQWDRCEHRLSGQDFGVSWRGMDVVCSYSLTVPTISGCALPNLTMCPG